MHERALLRLLSGYLVTFSSNVKRIFKSKIQVRKKSIMLLLDKFCQITKFRLFPNLSFPNIWEMKQKDMPKVGNRFLRLGQELQVV